MNAALKGLVAEGGLVPAEDMRDRRWQQAKLRYEVVQKRQAKVRSRDQLREERQQTWDEAHQRFYSTHFQTTTTYQNPAECPICATIVASFPTKFPRTQEAKDVAWWERPSGLVADHLLVPSTPVRRVDTKKKVFQAQPPSVLRNMVQESRRDMIMTEAYRQTWERRYRTESAIRRKHGLGPECPFPDGFWDVPIGASLARQYYQIRREEERTAERRARGNAPRQRPPRSSLSLSEHSDEVEVDEEELKHTWRMEDLVTLERQVMKVREEVGYLYFVGEVDGFWEWEQDFLKSDRRLIYRKLLTDAEPESVIEACKSSEESESEAEDVKEADSDEEGSKDSGSEEEDSEDADNEDGEPEESGDEMEIDG